MKERFREETWRAEKVYPMSRVLQGKQRKHRASVILEGIKTEGFQKLLEAQIHTLKNLDECETG